jgi:hypothetical protein
LPDTSADGAGRFADNVAGAVRDGVQQPQVIIYTYPSAWFIDGVETGHPGQTLPQHVHRTAAELLPFVAEGMAQTHRLLNLPSPPTDSSSFWLLRCRCGNGRWTSSARRSAC